MKRFASVLIIPLLIAPHAHAQERETLEPVVVTATKIEEPTERLGATVTINRTRFLGTWSWLG